jgi:hypothetical protein
VAAEGVETKKEQGAWVTVARGMSMEAAKRNTGALTGMVDGYCVGLGVGYGVGAG